MSRVSSLPIRIHLFLLCLSSSIIAYQIILMQYLSIVQWHHFAYMIISIALLGFASAGTIISIFRNYFMSNYGRLAPVCSLFCGIMMIAAPVLSQHKAIRFDSYLLFNDSGQIINLALTYVLFALPVFCGALSIGLLFAKYSERIGSVYFSNLAGSAFGGIIAIVVLSSVSPGIASFCVSIPAIIAFFVIIEYRRQILLAGVCFLMIFSILVFFTKLPVPMASEYKGISGALRVPDAEVVYEKNSPYGYIQIVENPVQRYAPGISLNYKGTVPKCNGIYVNGDWYGPILNPAEMQDSGIFNYTLYELPYLIGSIKSVLILNAGNGPHLHHSFTKRNAVITGIEPHPVLAGLMRNSLKSDNSLSNRVKIINTGNRRFLVTGSEKYDLIVMPDIGSPAGSSGLMALKEDYVLTVESFNNTVGHLSKDGMISITAWIDNPVRNSYRILSLIKESIKGQIGMDPAKCLFSISNWNAVLFLFKVSGFSLEEMRIAEDFCNRMSFDIVLPAEIASGRSEAANEMQDRSYSENIAKIFSLSAEEFYSNYLFNINPPTDDRPYFFQFIKIKKINEILNTFKQRDVIFFETGYLLVFVTLLQAVIISFLLIILPLFKTGLSGKNISGTLLYFGGIAIGYMLIEICLIQKFVLYVGNAVFASSIVIGIFLFSSGIGSKFSNRIEIQNRRMIKLIFLAIIVFIFVYAQSLDWMYKNITELSASAGIILSILFIMPLGFFMGIPFPVGIRLLKTNNEKAIPWAWGINGAFSVVSSILAVIIAVEYGYYILFILSAVPYIVSMGIIKKIT